MTWNLRSLTGGKKGGISGVFLFTMREAGDDKSKLVRVGHLLPAQRSSLCLFVCRSTGCSSYGRFVVSRPNVLVTYGK